MQKVVLSCLFVIAMVGCRSEEITDYVIFDYNDIKAKVASNSPDLSPYKIQDTLLTPFLAHNGYDSQSLSLLMWGADRRIAIKSISILSGTNHTFNIDKRIDMSKLKIKPDGHKEVVLLHKLLNSLLEPNDCELALSIDVEAGGRVRTMKYLNRK